MKKIILKKASMLLFASILIFFSGCFKKDVMVDTADDVEEAVIMDVNGEKFLVVKEEIFQATSKESGRGLTRTSGYVEYRISTYDLNTGNLVKRIDLGEREDNNHYFLGPANGKLWYVSCDKEIGLHARDPKTLEIVVSQNEIFNINEHLRDNLPHPKYYEYRKYYGLDKSLDILMVSDNTGFVFYLDPVSLKTQKTDKSIVTYRYDETAKTTSMQFDSETYLNLSGEPRKTLKVKSKDYPELSFLDGNFMFSTTKLSLSEINPDFLAPIKREIDKYMKNLDSLNKLYDELKTIGISESDYKLRSVYYNIESAKRNLKQKEDELERNYISNSVIVSDDRGFFIIHKSNATDTAKVIISKIVLDENLIPSKKWDTYIPDVFYDPGKVVEKDGFEYVFSKGSPDFNTVRILYGDSKLIYIFMLHAVCLNSKNGNILWNIEL
ncbi:MAG: hypothetical protein JW917_00930 [Ignavibacteria bacterium]|nr:hypothetical protein [Ignavibacteria bacterium]